MSLAEIHQLLATNRQLIADIWQFFISVHLALFALIFTINPKRVTIFARLALVIAYFGFMYLNYHAQLDNYTYARDLIAAGRRLESDQIIARSPLFKAFQAGWIITYLPVIYGVSAALGTGLILLPQRNSRRAKSPAKTLGEA